MEYIKSSPLLRLIGTPSTGVWDRVAQVSFLHTKLGASEVVAQLNKAGICCRNGQPPRYLIQTSRVHSLTDRCSSRSHVRVPLRGRAAGRGDGGRGRLRAHEPDALQHAGGVRALYRRHREPGLLARGASTLLHRLHNMHLFLNLAAL